VCDLVVGRGVEVGLNRDGRKPNKLENDITGSSHLKTEGREIGVGNM